MRVPGTGSTAGTPSGRSRRHRWPAGGCSSAGGGGQVFRAKVLTKLRNSAFLRAMSGFCCASRFSSKKHGWPSCCGVFHTVQDQPAVAAGRRCMASRGKAPTTPLPNAGPPPCHVVTDLPGGRPRSTFRARASRTSATFPWRSTWLVSMPRTCKRADQKVEGRGKPRELTVTAGRREG